MRCVRYSAIGKVPIDRRFAITVQFPINTVAEYFTVWNLKLSPLEMGSYVQYVPTPLTVEVNHR